MRRCSRELFDSPVPFHAKPEDSEYLVAENRREGLDTAAQN